MISIDQYRAVIGSFHIKLSHRNSQSNAENTKNAEGNPRMGLLVLLVILAMLIIGGVEQNPGPSGRGSRPADNTRQTQLKFSNSNSTNYEDFQEQLNELRTEIDFLRDENCKLKSRIHNLEKEKKKLNIVIHGVEEPANGDDENYKQSVKSAVSGLKLDQPINDTNIKNAFRAGKIKPVQVKPGEKPKPRPLIVTLDSFNLKKSVMDAIKNLKNKSKVKDVMGDIRISYDYTPQERDNYRNLLPFLERLKAENPNVKCFIRYDRLICGKMTYKLNDICSDIVEVKD